MRWLATPRQTTRLKSLFHWRYGVTRGSGSNAVMEKEVPPPPVAMLLAPAQLLRSVFAASAWRLRSVCVASAQYSRCLIVGTDGIRRALHLTA